jgi:L-glyceraldehyde 3-phosphate reductase
MAHTPSNSRYNNMKYNRCGKSGLKLPAISLGLWHNFGGVDTLENQKRLITTSFDLGITHFDLANNYGPPPGSAEENFGRILHSELSGYRDELVISTKAGYGMWAGPYGDWGSRKYLISSLDQSLKRMNLDYVDIFYSHRPDPNTPIEETMMALDQVVRQGKALYVGISNYSAEQTAKASKILKELGTPCLIHQPRYSMFDRWIENGLQEVLEEEGIGSIAFCPLAQGLLTNKYINGVPQDSRAANPTSPFLNSDAITMEKVEKIKKLNDIAQNRNQSLAQMSLAWVLRNGKVTSALIGASKVSQIIENVQVVNNLDFSEEELRLIDEITK